MTNPDRTSEDVTLALRAVLARWAAAQLPPRLTVAFSGGLDSTVLLAALCRLELPARVRAAHVDHGLHPQSAAWSAHCASTAAALGAEFVAARVAVDLTAGQGLEAAARDARYRVLGELLAPGEWLLTAHHGDDQLETLLLRLLRGTGVRGLRGIIAFGPFAGGSLGRPLLGFTREQLRAQALAWNLRLARGSVEPGAAPRPQLPALAGAARVARALAERGAARRAPRRADERGGTAARRGGGRGRAGRSRRRGTCRARRSPRCRRRGSAICCGTCCAPSASALRARARSRSCALRCSKRARARVRSCVGRAAKAAYFARHCISVRRCRRARRSTHAARIGLDGGWTGPEGRLAFVPAGDADGLPESWLAEGLTLRFRAGGERFRPRGRPHHSLKHLFQESGVVPWMRGRVPLLYRADSLVAIGDLWISADVDAAPPTSRAGACNGPSIRPCMHRNGASALPRGRGWSCRGTFDTLQYRLDAPNTQLRWPDEGFPWEGRPVLPVLT